MSGKQKTGKILISAFLSVTGLLNGCASYNVDTSLLAKKQAKSIALNLPVKSAGYIFVSAQSSGSSVNIMIISEAPEQATLIPDAFLNKFQHEMCADTTIKAMMNNGINYIITINDTHTGNQYQRKLERTACETIKT